MLMLLPQPTYCSEGVANFDPSEDKVDVITPVVIIIVIIIIIMTIVSVEQRPGWSEHV
jgi:hypothetical protein